jgi:hypothetical protein
VANEDKRTEPRIEVKSGTAEIDGQEFPLKNWSSRGFLIGSYEGNHRIGDIVDIKFSVPFVGSRKGADPSDHRTDP